MIAVLILAHKSPELLGRLVKRLESYGAQCFIHVDAKVDIRPFQAACSAANPIFIEPRTEVTWGGFSIVEATISLLSAALLDSRFTYFVLISGDTYPVKPREQFRHLVTRPFDQIGAVVVPPTSETFKRISWTYFPNTLIPFTPDAENSPAVRARMTEAISAQIKRTFEMKQKGFRWRYSKGGQWWSLTRETAQKCMDLIKSESELIEWFTYSVVPDEAFFQTILENYGPFPIGGGMPVYTLWDPSHSTSHPIVFTDPADFPRIKKTISPFGRKFSLEQGSALLDLLDSWMDNNNDLAYCKPAVSSSVSPWARYQDPERDARGANGESFAWDHGFFTRSEREPWWTVDLLREYTVEEIAIINRLNEPQRFRTFAILSSGDEGIWRTRFTQSVPIDVSSDPDSPWRLRFTEPFRARYVRIALLGTGYLHLRRVQIFGRALDGSSNAVDLRMDANGDVAYCKPATSSSVSPWTPYQDPEEDARGATGVSLAEDCAFFTAEESEPWWMVNLLGDYAIEEIAIVNRVTQPQRFRAFSIASSSDGKVWTMRFTQTVPINVPSDPESPWRVQFADPFAARYVRIALLGVGYLHLRRVQIFGRALADQPYPAADASRTRGD
jgi:Core-2/I-Branching enzyme/F5/8 type C domain